MTPTEEIFSRRGGVKLLLMEVEQLRCALDKLQQPACAHRHTGPGGTQEVGVQILQGSRKRKDLGPKGEKRAACSPSAVVRAMPGPAMVQPEVIERPSPARGNEPNSGLFQRGRAPGITRRVAASATAEGAAVDPERPEANPKAAPPFIPYLPRISSLPHATRRMSKGQAGSTTRRGSLQDVQTESIWTEWPSPLPSAREARRDLQVSLVSIRPTVTSVLHGNSRRIEDHQQSNRRIEDQQDQQSVDNRHIMTIHHVSQSRSSGIANSAPENGGQGHPGDPGRHDNHTGSGPPPLLKPPPTDSNARQRGSRLHEVLASLPPLK